MMANETNEVSNLHNTEKLSLSSNQICLVPKKKVCRKTEADRKANCLYMSIDDAVELLKGGGTWHECLIGDGYTKPYFDAEQYCDDQPSDYEIKNMLRGCRYELFRIFGDHEAFDIERDVAVCSRHRWVVKDGVRKFKVSFHLFVLCFKMKWTEILLMLKDFNHTVIPNWDVGFDLEVYKPSQLLGCIGCCKDDEPDYPMVSVDGKDWKCYIAQYTEGIRTTLDFSHLKKEKPKREVVIEKPPANIDEIKALVAMLKIERCDNYGDWLRVGWCLKNIDEGLLSLWIEWSKKSKKFKDGECEKVWGVACDNGRGLTIGSLKYWAKADNPDAYKEYFRNCLFELIRTAKSKTHYDIVKVMYYMYGDRFVYTPNEVWYEFKKHRWNKVESGYTLRELMPTELATEFMRVATYYTERSTRADVKEEEKDSCVKTAKELQEIYFKLKMTTFQKQLLDMATILFMNEEFDTMLDSKENLIGFTNGIFDLNEDIFRDGRPEDYVSKSTKLEYTNVVSKTHRDEVMNFFNSIMDSEEMTTFLLDILGINLHGIKRLHMFLFWVGLGGNGKGITANLYANALGDYFYSPAIELFTTTRKSSSSANPELAKVRGVRGCISTEPEEDQTIYVGLLKKWTGDDLLQGRELYGKPVEFKPQSYPIIQMNKKPVLSGNDGGVARRMRIINFPYQFVDTPSKPNEKQIDIMLADKFKETEYLQQFMLILIERYRLYKEGNFKLHTPQRVLDDTQEYLDENNHVKNFIYETFDIVQGAEKEKHIISSSALFAEYRNYARFHTLPVSKQSIFNQGLQMLGFPVVTHTLRGIYHKCKVVYGLQTKCQIAENDEYE